MNITTITYSTEGGKPTLRMDSSIAQSIYDSVHGINLNKEHYTKEDERNQLTKSGLINEGLTSSFQVVEYNDELDKAIDNAIKNIGASIIDKSELNNKESEWIKWNIDTHPLEA